MTTANLFRATQSPSRPGTPTVYHYQEFQRAFDFYNGKLFYGDVPQVLIVMTRRPRTHGYLATSRWADSETGDLLHELALNPVDFAMRSAEDVLSTLVHEMCHAWQQSRGLKPPRKGYHNKEWVERMEDIGLIPSNTGEPGGKQTGQSMTHYIDEDGEFQEQTMVLLDTGWTIPYLDIPEEEKKRKNNRPKYVCPQCELQAWAKTGLAIACLNCKAQLAEEAPEEEDEDQDKALAA